MKIAYADFVTAMMCVLLLMWLLGSTTKGTFRALRLLPHAAQGGLHRGIGAGETSSVIQGGSKGFLRPIRRLSPR